MYQEKFILEWNSHSDHLRKMLHNMNKSSELTDVTLLCDDKRQLKAHFPKIWEALQLDVFLKSDNTPQVSIIICNATGLKYEVNILLLFIIDVNCLV